MFKTKTFMFKTKTLRTNALHKRRKQNKRVIRWSVEAVLLILSITWAVDNLTLVPKSHVEAQNSPVAVSEPSMKDYVLEEVKEAKLDPFEAYMIIQCESRWNTEQITIEPNDTVSTGLWQINSIHTDIKNSDKLNYKSATKWAIKKRLHDGNWSSWSCAKKLGIK